MNTDKVLVTFVTDHNYLLPTWVALKSLIDSKFENTDLVIYIIGDNLSADDREKLEGVAEGEENVAIHFINVDSNTDFIEKLGNDDLKSWSPAVLYKFMLCDILPKEVHKIIYLDGDMLIRQDLLQLYQTDLTGVYLGAVRDTFYDVVSHEQRMNLQGKYFNTGCLLLNLDKMREDKLAEKLLKKKKECPELGLADQDTYNEVCRGKVLLLPLKYNFYITNFLMDESMEGFKKYTTCPYESRKEMIEDIAIIHMIHYRPWKLRVRKKEISILFMEDEVSIWKSSISYIVCHWISLYKKSPFFDEQASNISVSPKNEDTCLSIKGVTSYTKLGPIKGKVIQECKEGNIHVSLWIGKVRLLEKVRVPGKSSRIYLF